MYMQHVETIADNNFSSNHKTSVGTLYNSNSDSSFATELSQSGSKKLVQKQPEGELRHKMDIHCMGWILLCQIIYSVIYPAVVTFLKIFKSSLCGCHPDCISVSQRGRLHKLSFNNCVTIAFRRNENNEQTGETPNQIRKKRLLRRLLLTATQP